MTKEARTLQKIITAECANFFNMQNGISNLCVEQDQPCKYFTDKQLPRCRYLEKAILPAEWNKPALAMYQALHLAKQDGIQLTKAKVRSVMKRAEVKGTTECGRCGTRFRAKSNRQTYCDICRKIVQREKTRIRVQNLRSPVSM